MSFGFSPALPNLPAMRAGVSLSGRFSASMDTTVGHLAILVPARHASQLVIREAPART
jgi:hypothetical protein